MWDSKDKTWKEDEWLTQIYQNLCDAKEALYKFAEGHPFDNGRENQVTRYFGKAKTMFDKGIELTKGDPDIIRHEWMRYAVFRII